MSKKKKKLSPVGKPRIPVGSMCTVCTKKYDDCSQLPFDSYSINVIDEDSVMVVCKEYDKEPYRWTSEQVQAIIKQIP